MTASPSDLALPSYIAAFVRAARGHMLVGWLFLVSPRGAAGPTVVVLRPRSNWLSFVFCSSFCGFLNAANQLCVLFTVTHY